MGSSKSSSHSACTERRAPLPRPPRALIVQAVQFAAPEARSRSCAGGASDARQRTAAASQNNGQVPPRQRVAVIQRLITTVGSNLRNAPVAVESVPPERTVIVPVLRGRICEL